MNELLSLPHLEVFGLIAGLGIASVAGWTANAMLNRAKLVERDVDALRYEIRRLRHEVVPVAAGMGYERHPVAPMPHPTQTVPPQPTQPVAPVQQPEPPRLQPIQLSQATAETKPTTREARPHAVSFGRPAAETPVPDVKQIAEQLGVQSPEAIANLLSGELSLGDAAREMGTGRQEARLLYWLHGQQNQEQPNA